MAIASGLRALLSQMGLAQQLAGGKGSAKEAGAKASAMKGEKGSAEGQLLGEDGLLLSGLGYAGHDKHTARKNVAERSNLTRFLREQMKDGTAPEKGKLTSEEALLTPRDAPEAGEAETAEAQEGQEAHEAPRENEARAKDRREDGRVQGQKDTSEPTEARETKESAEAEQQQQQEQKDEEDKPGAGWVAEENEEEADENKRGLRVEDSLGHATRCRGHLDDGSRCLRKPSHGTPYCPEHAALWHPSKPSLRG